MTMRENRILQEAELYVKSIHGADASGHDWRHVERVVNMTAAIAEKEQANGFVCTLAALLHDVADEKLVQDVRQAEKELEDWLRGHVADPAVAEHVLEIIAAMSFKGGNRPPMRTLEGMVVQDADRLDALGAVGIARTFVYSGWAGRPMHDPDVSARDAMTASEYRSGSGTAVNHFYEKLLKLKDLMNTGYAKRLAEERHRYMEGFLEQFYAEWDGKR